MKQTHKIVLLQLTLLFSCLLFGITDTFSQNNKLILNPFGDIEGHVTNGSGQTIAGVNVGVDGFTQTTTNPMGYYLLEGLPIGQNIVVCLKDGYNINIDSIIVIQDDTVNLDFTLTQPNITVVPSLFSVTLNPNEYLTQYLSLLNTGDGDGEWTAVINYPSSGSSSGKQLVKSANPKDFSFVDYTQTDVISIPGGNGEPLNLRSGFDCPDGTVFSHPPLASDNGYSCEEDAGMMCYQKFSGVIESITTVTIYAIHTSAASGQRELLCEVYGPGTTPGTIESSTIIMADPVLTGNQVLGYDTYSYTFDIPVTNLSEGWIGIQTTSGGSPIFYWLNTYYTPSYTAMQNNTVLPSGLAMCLSSNLDSWLTLDEYEGTVSANGGIQNVGVNFSAAGMNAGEFYTAEIVITTDPDVGIFTIPVTMSIAGDPLCPVTDLEVELVNMITSQVDIHWMFDFPNCSNDFQYFLIKRNGLAIGTTTEIFYADMLPAYGTYCYTVLPFFNQGFGTGATNCIEWEIPTLCWNPNTVYNEQWVNSQEQVSLTIENCGLGMLDFAFPDYVSGSRFVCDMEVALYDTYGDGWNGGSLDVFVNGNLVLDDITLTNGGGPEYFSFPVEGGDDISTIYTAGQWSYENYYEIYDGDGNLIYTAADESIPIGIVYGTCPQPSFILDVQPAMGQIPEGQSMNVTLTYDANGFPAGLYNEWLQLQTNDPLHQEDSIFNQMFVYTPATFYGYVNDCNSGLPIAGVEVWAPSTSTSNYTATTNALGYYEMNVDEDTYDVLFSLLGFETQSVIDTFASAGVMTEISICMSETPYPVSWVWATPDEIAGSCMVEWGLPMGPYEIIYDDGEPDDYVIWTEPGNMAAVKFTPVGYPATIIGGRFNVGDGTFPVGANFIGSTMIAMVMDDDGANGMPGTMIDSASIIVGNYGWVDFYGSFNITIQDGEFFIVLQQTGYSNNSAPIAVDTDPPTVYRSYTKMANGSWSISPYQDFMIRAYVDGPNAGVVSNSAGKNVKIPKVTEGPFLATNLPNIKDGVVKDGEINPVEGVDANRDLVNYTIARVSDFYPDAGPQTGILTPIANLTSTSLNDVDWGSQDTGFYAYAVKSVYESNESDWVYSNTVPHFLYNTVTIIVHDCNDSIENVHVNLIGMDYPYESFDEYTNINGVAVFDSVIDGIYDLFFSGVGYNIYEHLGLAVFEDFTYSAYLEQKMYPPTNLVVDPLTSIATWEPPMITQLYLEDFEDPQFPPDGWQATSLGYGWYRSDGSGGDDWVIPPSDGFYAISSSYNWGSTGSNNTADYLITPMLDLRESDAFELHFSQFFDGAWGQSAYVEYSIDNGDNWTLLETMSPNPDWNNEVVDLSSISGSNSSLVWLAFHADDHGDWASGWCVDNIEVKNGPAPVMAYYVFLDNVFEAQTSWDITSYAFNNLVFGEEYEACVMAVYDCGTSDPICSTWESVFLQAPRNLTHDYTYGTNEVLLMWNPPATATSSMAAPFKIVYQGPQLAYVNPDSDIASEVTIIEYEKESSREMGDLQFSFPNLGTSEAGCETDGDYIYTAEWNSDFYLKYDLNGNLIETFTVPGTSGVRDMAWDGNLFYGAAANSTVFVMDFDTKTLVSTFTAPTDVRAIAYNHIDFTFYANNWGTDIVCFDQNGNNLGSFTPNVSSIYGLAFDNWSDAGKYLWAYDQGENNLLQYSLPAGVPTGLTIDVEQITGSTGISGGLFSHEALYDPYEVSLGGVAQNDIVWVLEIASYTGGGSGEIPEGLTSFNLYRDGVNVANIPYEGQGIVDWIEYIDNDLIPNPYVYEVTAEYALDIFGFPGQTAESDFEGPDTVNVVWGSIIPFFEDWGSANFNFNNWTFNENSANWSISSQEGEPAPSAEFTWDPLLENDYSSTLTSYPIIVDYITEGDLFLTFDLKLIDRNTTGNEHMMIEIFDGTTWHLAADFSNSGSRTGFSNHILNITPYTTGNAINVRFNATGQNSFDIISWFVDNISVYRECTPPEDLIGYPEWSWDPLPVCEICWDAQNIPMPISEWVHWDSGENYNSVGLTDGGTFSVAARWDESQLIEYENAAITKIRFVPIEGYTEIIMKVWLGNNAESLIYSEDVTSLAVAEEWNEFSISQSIQIDPNEELWVGYTVTHTAGTFPAGADEGPAIYGYGDMITTDGITWDPVSSFGLNYNWNIQIFVTEQSSGMILPVLKDEGYTNLNESISVGGPRVTPIIAMDIDSRDISGFNIYRMTDLETEYQFLDAVEFVVGQTEYCYQDEVTNHQIGYFYKVTAHYISETDECESSPAMAYEIPQDDFVYILFEDIETNDELSEIDLYPIPTNNKINIKSKSPIGGVRIMSLVGQNMYSEVINSSRKITIDTEKYPQGIYLVQVETISGITTKKIVISR